MQHVENPEARVSQSDCRCEPALWGTVGAPNIITMEDESDDSDDNERDPLLRLTRDSRASMSGCQTYVCMYDL